jgi:uncharacterized protein (TIGR03435 family)
MTKDQVRVGAAIAFCASVAIGSAQSSQPSFDVASVKENTSRSETAAFGIPPPTPGRMRIVNTPLRFILHYAFQVGDHQLINAPGWADSASFDITATFPADSPRTEDDTRATLRALLAERFGLKTHRERRDLPIYSLVMARMDGALGPQLVRSTIDCEQWIAEKRPQLGAGSASPVAPGGKRPVCRMLATRRFITAGTQTMQQLTGPLQAFTGRPVVDRTGLAGAFDFDLQWTSGPAAPAAGAAPSPDDGPSIFAALQEQLGLRLEPGRGTFDVVVIDAIQRPTPD